MNKLITGNTEFYIWNDSGLINSEDLAIFCSEINKKSMFDFSLIKKDTYISLSLSNVQKKVSSSEFECGGGEVLPIFGSSKLWIKYKFSNYYLHIEFHNNEESISMITLEVM